MFAIGPIGFAVPVLLIALIALPILWLLLRAVPPAPIQRRFPGIALLLGLTDDDNETDRTPWWLLLLRCLAVAGAILAFAGPVLNPNNRAAGSGPVLILLDGTWASGPIWDAGMDRVEDALNEATRDGRTTAIMSLTNIATGGLIFQTGENWASRLPSFTPAPWEPDTDAINGWIETLASEPDFDTIWLSDGIGRANRNEILEALEGKGDVSVFESPRTVLAIEPARFEDGLIKMTVLRNRTAGAVNAEVVARGRDPAGTERDLVRATAEFADGESSAEISITLPAELRNRITRFEVPGSRSAGSVALTDDGLKRREIALIAGREDREGLELLSPLHYLERALVPTADMLEGGLMDVLPANPDVIILADVAQLGVAEGDALSEWLTEGGLLVRFAGPRLAASDVSRAELDPLMPVRLRVGGRNVGGAMSWGEPKTLLPFDPDSPFFGLPVPDEVNVTAQVMAQPDADLAEHVIASLADGTPLITRRAIGQGQIVLFHVTANAEWSTLPLSGLFVQMLERLARSTRPARPDAADLIGTTWVPEKTLTGFGLIEDAGTRPGVPGEILAENAVGPDLRPGLYRGEDRHLAVNLIEPETTLEATNWPSRIPVEGLGVDRETPLKGMVLAFSLILLMVDIIASLWLSGRIKNPRTAAAGIVIAVLSISAPQADAQSANERAILATSDVVLAYVQTGDVNLDGISEAGLRGLSDRLTRRTSIEPADPIAVDLERDELSFYPFLYWPVTANQDLPSQEAYARLNRYLRGGGLILFDTRDADFARAGATPEGRRLQALARPLDIPPLETIPSDHVLTRTFYLLQDFPGRQISRNVWVEAAPPGAVRAEGMPFRNLNDGVTPVVIGGNDWAAAWAIDQNGAPLFPVGRGFSGERQREIAYRFGINLIMHTLTGNYKSDQVHVPALLDRIGQ